MPGLRAMLDEQGSSRAERVTVDGRVALLLCDGTERWPYATFLEESGRPRPRRFCRQAMRQASSMPGPAPDLAVSSMVPRPTIDLGADSGRGRRNARAGRPLAESLRTLLLWLFFVGVLAAVFRLTRPVP